MIILEKFEDKDQEISIKLLEYTSASSYLERLSSLNGNNWLLLYCLWRFPTDSLTDLMSFCEKVFWICYREKVT